MKIAPPAIAAPRTVPAAAPKPAAVVNTAAKPYTIVAVTLTRRDTAAAEVSKLKSRGINAFIVPSDRYFQVCVGAYPDKAGVQVQKDLKKIRRLYKDAYLKLRSTQ
ncbi:MAG: SPOR domain-containing protein [Candidatus Omnitrophica bacterium]|nr:SPOR domain-containing protein [Candidatus Omnitrophota bacterium]